MRIHLMQHGVCLPKELDPQQPLSPVGREIVEKSGIAAQKMGLAFDAIVSSPKQRAMQTAKIMAEATSYPAKAILVTDAVKAKAPVSTTMDYLSDLGAESILVCGHLPSLNEVASHLLVQGPGLNIAIENGGIMRIDTDSPATRATLSWYLSPAQLGLVAAS
ncbi:SixA phosphatase family protein [Pseudodesulfovibrio tunisiensis]|uniref:SixA phosphatase family protein n=1 Tax=Pseudodesulfovibrio tunisiensis TaxID=463192 RepID=UPI001FB29E41|nr:histidine phosphatase family protein [Pseudodesulfovibrio tunisiensis]